MKQQPIPAYPDVQSPSTGSQAYVTTMVLGIAAWLIFNSHLEDFYPLPWLAADGLLGNTLFFVISGLGIFSSLTGRRQTLADYLARRFWRLYPAVLIVLLIKAFFINHPASYSALELLKSFLWPTPFTYVAIIVPMYFLAFGFYRLRPKRAAILLGVFCLGVYVFTCSQTLSLFPAGTKLTIGTLPALVSYSYFGFAFCLGGIIANGRQLPQFKYSRFLLMAFLICLYVGLKYSMVIRGMGAVAYPLLHGLVLLICLLSLKTLCARDTVDRFLAGPIVGPFLRRSGGLSLEIYLVHAMLLHIVFFSSIMFPLNIFLFATITFVLAIVLQNITGAIQLRFGK